MAEPRPAGRFCEMCGAAATTAARFCAACGEPLRRTAESATPASPPDDRESQATPAAGPERELFVLRPLVLQTVLELARSVLTVGIWALVLWLRRMQAQYRITTQRIELRDGLVNVRRRTIELFRVQDFEVVEPLFLRIRGAGNLVIRSLDPEEGEVTLVAVPDVHAVYEQVRAASLTSRRGERVRVFEGM
jgi:hypothetical protein